MSTEVSAMATQSEQFRPGDDRRPPQPSGQSLQARLAHHFLQRAVT